MERLVNIERKHEMYEAILSLESIEECEAFFEDLCALNELKTMEQRYAVAQMLVGDKVYSEITEETKASSATISRVKRMLQQGHGVMMKIIEKQQKEKQS